MKKLIPRAVAVALVGVALFAVASAGAANTTLSVSMNGKQEVPKGDPNGKGTAKVTLQPSKGRVCFNLTWHRIGNPVASHIHQGKKGTSGPIVIPFFAGTAKHTGCVKAAKSLINKIAKKPSNYYVNIHTAAFPGGALRGQL
jgi:CHRD domain